jgi:hypothetical protein
MNKDQEQMLIETHAFSKMNHNALHGPDGLIFRVTTAESAWRTFKAICICFGAVLTIGIAIVAVAVGA